MQAELEERLADYHGVRHVIAFANASLALIALLRHCSRDDTSDILLPTFTYRGLPHLIQWAGKMPLFADVELATHTLSAPLVREAIGDRRIAAILAVNHVNAPADLDGLAEICRALEIPLIYDSVYAIGAEYRGKTFGHYGTAEVFSLHATKLLNGFEGGYVTTNDDALADALTSIRNFGFDTKTPAINFLGMNGKLNEIHAAMALGSLENIDGILDRNRAQYETYRQEVKDVPGLEIVAPVDDLKPNHEMILLRVSSDAGVDRDLFLKLLQAENALVRPLFSPPLHRSKHCPPSLEVGPLPNSEYLARHYLQLPTGGFLKPGDAERLGETIRFIVGHGDEIVERVSRSVEE